MGLRSGFAVAVVWAAAPNPPLACHRVALKKKKKKDHKIKDISIESTQIKPQREKRV